MAYVIPQVKVYQEFQTAASAVAQPLYSFITGPNYYLFRYDVEEEKLLVGIGEYDRASGNDAAWPNKPVGAEVDQAWTRLFFDNAWLEYFRDYVGSGHVIQAVDDYPNRIASPTLIFKTYGAYPRSTELQERDVQVGDGVILRANVCGGQQTFVTKVAGFVNDVLPAVVDVPTVDANNAPDSVVGAVMTQEAGTAGTVGFSADGSAYNGAADGDTIESYFLEVTVGGAFGTAQMQVTSGSGHDDMVDPFIPQNGVAVDVGSRGLTATFALGSVATPFEVGQIFRVDVNQTWFAALCERDAGAAYVGASDGTYIVTVVVGGLWADSPQVFVTSTGTLDSSGPYIVTPDAYITLPTGVKLRFPTSGGQLGLAKDDRFYVEVDAAKAGPIHTLSLLNSLPSWAFGLCESGYPETKPDLDLSLSIIKNIEVPRTKLGVLYNWTTSVTAIMIEPGIQSRDASWHNSVGSLLDMYVIRATMYVQYRALRFTYSDGVYDVSSIGDVIDLLGPVVADNPLALGVYKAKENSGSTPVKFMATRGVDLADFTAVLDAIYDREDTYGLVALTHTKTIQDAFFAHVKEASTAERGRWRVMWNGCTIEEVSAVVQEDSYGNMLFCTISEDPDTPGTQYTRLRCDEATFVASGVKAGDTVRTEYYLDPSSGEERYSEYLVDAVLTEEEVRLYTGPTIPITVPSRFEIWKTNTHAEIAQQVINQAGSYAHRRVRLVFPDWIGNGGVQYDSMFVCCSLAGLRSGVWPHQGLTNVEISGYDDVSRTTDFLGGALLDLMAENGVWIVAQDESGMIYTRHQLTTDVSDILHKEDSLVANFDSISYRFLHFFRDSRYIGRRNITPQLLTQIRIDLNGVVQSIVYESDTPELGPQILNAEILRLERHPTLADHVVATVRLTLPAPFNNFDLTLIAQV